MRSWSSSRKLCLGLVLSLTALEGTLFFAGFGETWNSMAYKVTPRRCRPANHTYALTELTARACAALNAAEIEYFLIDGTLLGAMNIGEAINTDRDADIGYFTADMPRVAAALKARFTVRGLGDTVLDLKRYAVNHTRNSVDRVNAQHELSGWYAPIAVLEAWYNGFQASEILPLNRYVGGNGPLRHCKIPYRAEALLAKMFQLPFQPLSSCPVLAASERQRIHDDLEELLRQRGWRF